MGSQVYDNTAPLHYFAGVFREFQMILRIIIITIFATTCTKNNK